FDAIRIPLYLSWADPHSALLAPWKACDCGNGTADGIACDADGNLWCGWGSGNEELDGVRIFNPQGKHIGTIKLPERCANLCFGGEQRNRLFMASSTSIYSLYVNAQGAKLI
ncbi:SMP-30/gluconolactonase/LRE family protein, partial [Klebsiella pneumoniae]